MSYFRKKPVVIEAVKFDGRLVGALNAAGEIIPGTVPTWLPAVVREVEGPEVALAAGDIVACGTSLYIGTLEGTHRADAGDWIILGVKGELYPCKPDIFAATYEPV